MYIFYEDREKIDWCYKNCGSCTECKGKKDGKKCDKYPKQSAVDELARWNKVLFEAGLEEKYIAKIKTYKKEKLVHIVEKGQKLSIFYKKGRTSLNEDKIDYLSRLLELGVSEEYINELAGSKVTATKIHDAYWALDWGIRDKKAEAKTSEEMDKLLKQILDNLEARDQKEKKRPLDKKQQNEIDRMKALGVDTTLYERNTIKPGILREIRVGFEHGVDPSVYYRKGHQLRQWQCAQVRMALEAKLPDDIINMINNKELVPVEMAALRTWYTDTDEETREYAKNKFGENYMKDPLLRRVLMIPNVNKFKELREPLLENYELNGYFPHGRDSYCPEKYEDFKEFPVVSNFEYIFRMLIIQNMDINSADDVEKCKKIIKEFNIYYRKACREFYDMEQVTKSMDCEMSDQEQVDFKCDRINKFFSEHFGKTLKQACEILDIYKNPNEYNLEGNIFLDFDTAYTNNKHIVWNQYC